MTFRDNVYGMHFNLLRSKTILCLPKKRETSTDYRVDKPTRSNNYTLTQEEMFSYGLKNPVY